MILGLEDILVPVIHIHFHHPAHTPQLHLHRAEEVVVEVVGVVVEVVHLEVGNLWSRDAASKC